MRMHLLIIFYSNRTTIRMRTLLRFTIALSYWLQARHLVQAVNITVADTDPAIQYQPEEWWFSSTNLCSTCLNPGLSSSFHEGVNPISLGLDSDDNTTTNPPPSTATPPPPASNTQVVNPITSPPTTPSTTTPPDPDATSDSDPDSHKSKGSKRSLNMALVQRLDTDDLPANQTVTLSYNFTGKCEYCDVSQFCLTMSNSIRFCRVPVCRPTTEHHRRQRNVVEHEYNCFYRQRFISLCRSIQSSGHLRSRTACFLSKWAR